VGVGHDSLETLGALLGILIVMAALPWDVAMTLSTLGFVIVVEDLVLVLS